MKQLFSKDNRGDVLIGVIVLVCLLLSSRLFSGFMPSSVLMVLIAIFAATVSLFAIIVWRESPRDEREAHLLLFSDRLGFLAGAVVLSLGLVVSSIRHESTTVLALALAAMILAKLLGKYLK